MKKTLIVVFLICVLSITCFSGCTFLILDLLTMEDETTTEETNSNNLETTSTEETTTEEITKTELELTEDEYKAKCQELYYDDVFFGDTNLKNTYVKLDLMLSEKYFFTNDDMLTQTFKDFNSEYNLNRNFYKCCVLRKDTTSYMGRQISMWFSGDYDLSAEDYKTGQKVIIYGKVIHWSDNTKDGYNSVIIIPKYIENK